MKVLLTISRIIVGVLFIFSGLIKANDPLGLSYKMQEFFEVWGWHGWGEYTLALSVTLIAFEIIAGVAVLVGWQFKIFSWLLLGLILCFTFLTGYAVLSGKIKECGCFGDCIKLTAMDSFIKDLILTGLILFLVIFRKRVQPVFNTLTSIIILLLAGVLSFSLQWYVLKHLPVLDCLPYKAGNNIQEKMKMPPGAIPDSSVITFVYQKAGKEVEFTSDKFPADFDSTYTFVRRYDKLLRKGNAEPAIKDFVIIAEDGADFTQEFLNEPGYELWLFLKDGYSESDWSPKLEIIMKSAQQKNIPGFIITNVPLDHLREQSPGLLSIMFPLRSDVTAIKTAARTNPTLYLVNQGTIINKWGVADFELALLELQKLEGNPKDEPSPPAIDSLNQIPVQIDSTIKK
ncbi:MAG TPA: BT_3928 family protein [Chitinophagaceae bacterium]|nr:BT_3928 family protein [Chitinophagaceae bacterium]